MEGAEDVIAGGRAAPATGAVIGPGSERDAIVVRGVRRSFGSVDALRGLDLTAPYGEVTALVGPNGAGKTTLLLILATLLVPDSGAVRIAGFDPVTETDAVRGRMGWTPDVFGIYDNLTAREYLEFVASAYRIPGPAAAETARRLLHLARLEEYADQPVHVLSRGQKQRLGLARALVHGPTVLLLDEPAAGLDPRSRVELRDVLRGLAAEGAAVLVSSHILADLEEMADRAVIVDHGVTVAEQAMATLPRHGTRTWRLRALDDARLASGLAALGHPATQVTANGVDVELESDEAAADLVAALVRDGVRLVSCAPVGGALEAAYLNLTGDVR